MKKIGVTGLLLLLLIVAAGCGQKPQASPGGAEPSKDSPITTPATVNAGGGSEGEQGTAGKDEGTSSEPNVQTPEVITKKIEVFFTDDQVTDLKTVEREITYTEDLIKYKQAFKALQTADPGHISLWEKVILNSVQFAEGEVAIDISLPDEARLGAGGESLAIDAIKQTYFQFDEVKTLELTVDGEKLDSLMGHVDLEHPFKK
ncbi:sporulation and spore germination protein [Fontibacillus phaseoli]|uniref:Sporulation and spore germination protein n=1 Tax=Fontibacillus phaseoli TaxID=1416533 RepID=A0A369BUS8_9BACL|nr:GerMN domain-containing protein [Fontibacillus phaseoli]RCX23364.1 sporulation and spore germination protein [Fontibacillus phaseoli]